MFKKLQNKIYILSKKYGKKFGFDFTYFLKNGFWMTFRQIIGMGTGSLLSVAFARLLSKDTFGQYQFIISIMSMISIISITGLNTSIIQSVARGYDGSYIKAVKIRFLWSLIGIPTLLIVGGYYYISESQTLGLALLTSGIFFPFFYALNTWDSFLQGKERFDLSAKYTSIQSIINTLFTISIVFFFRDNLIAIIIAYFASYSIFNVLWFWRSLKYIKNKEDDKEVIDYGLFLTKINILGIIANNIDKILVGSLLGPKELAIYAITSVIAIRLKDFLKTFSSILLPKLAMSRLNFFEILKMHQNKLIYFSMAILLISIIYYMGIPYINLLLFTEKYAIYSYLSKIYVITILLSMPLSFMGIYFYAKRNKFAISLINPFFYLIKILINIFFIYEYGLLGAVIAFNVSMIVWFLLHLFGIFYTYTTHVRK